MFGRCTTEYCSLLDGTHSYCFGRVFFHPPKKYEAREDGGRRQTGKSLLGNTIAVALAPQTRCVPIDRRAGREGNGERRTRTTAISPPL